jgi:hypothetical protein
MPLFSTRAAALRRNRQVQPSPWHRSRRAARRSARLPEETFTIMASLLLWSTGGAARVSRIGAVTSIMACSSASSVFSRRPTRTAPAFHKDIKAAESGKSLFERRGAAFGGRDIRRYAVDLGAPGLHRSNGFGDDFPAASADRHFRSLRQPLGSQPSSGTGRRGSQPMIDAGRRPGSTNTPAVPARTAATSGNKVTSLLPPREA